MFFTACRNNLLNLYKAKIKYIDLYKLRTKLNQRNYFGCFGLVESNMFWFCFQDLKIETTSLVSLTSQNQT